MCLTLSRNLFSVQLTKCQHKAGTKNYLSSLVGSMIWLAANIAIIIYGTTICVLNIWYKHVSFGSGLGDKLWELGMYLALTSEGIILLSSHDSYGFERHWIYSFLFGTFWIVLTLKATIFRGNEYRWNGKLFYDKTDHSSSDNIN